MQKDSNIGIHNYEEHIVNYLDGQSGPLETAELFLFLELHPELGVDLDDLSQMVVEPDLNVVYDFKEALKPGHDADAQQISSENYIYYFTAYIEGDLSQKGVKAVNRFVDQNPAFKSDLLLLEKCQEVKRMSLPRRQNRLQSLSPLKKKEFQPWQLCHL